MSTTVKKQVLINAPRTHCRSEPPDEEFLCLHRGRPTCLLVRFVCCQVMRHGRDLPRRLRARR